MLHFVAKVRTFAVEFKGQSLKQNWCKIATTHIVKFTHCIDSPVARDVRFATIGS